MHYGCLPRPVRPFSPVAFLWTPRIGRRGTHARPRALSRETLSGAPGNLGVGGSAGSSFRGSTLLCGSKCRPFTFESPLLRSRSCRRHTLGALPPPPPGPNPLLPQREDVPTAPPPAHDSGLFRWLLLYLPIIRWQPVLSAEPHRSSWKPMIQREHLCSCAGLPVFFCYVLL